MSEHTFTNWLQFEVNSARCALLKLIEKEDRMRYIEGPELERAYMEAVGHYEESVVKEEMECELLTTKQRLIQAAINRREPIDEAAIDEKIAALRQDMMVSAAGEGEPKAYAELSPEQAEELQKLYGQIVARFHPSMHPEMTQAHRALYEKAQDANRRRDLRALQLIWEMLTASDDEGLELAFSMVMSEGGSSDESVPTRDYSTDYSLASTLYSSFVPLREETAIIEAWNDYKSQISEKMEGIQEQNERFPFNARETITDPAKLADYKQSLEQRMRQAQLDRARLTEEIKKLIGGAQIRG